MGSNCPICLEDFAERIRASPDTCDHIFCITCLEKWSKLGSYCPVDRKRFKKIINLDSDVIIQVKSHKRRRVKAVYDFTTKCELCAKDDSAATLLLCDCCDLAFHTRCLQPPLEEVPSGLWFCPSCTAIEKRLKTENGITKKDEAEGLTKKNKTSYNARSQLSNESKKCEKLQSVNSDDSTSLEIYDNVISGADNIYAEGHCADTFCFNVLDENHCNLDKIHKTFNYKSSSTNQTVKYSKTYENFSFLNRIKSEKKSQQSIFQSKGICVKEAGCSSSSLNNSSNFLTTTENERRENTNGDENRHLEMKTPRISNTMVAAGNNSLLSCASGGSQKDNYLKEIRKKLKPAKVVLCSINYLDYGKHRDCSSRINVKNSVLQENNSIRNSETSIQKCDSQKLFKVKSENSVLKCTTGSLVTDQIFATKSKNLDIESEHFFDDFSNEKFPDLESTTFSFRDLKYLTILKDGTFFLGNPSSMNDEGSPFENSYPNSCKKNTFYNNELKNFKNNILSNSENKSSSNSLLSHGFNNDGRFFLKKSSFVKYEDSPLRISHPNSCNENEFYKNKFKKFTDDEFDFFENKSFCKEDLKYLTVVDGTFLLQKPNPVSNKSATNPLQVFEEKEFNEFSYTKFNSCCKREKLDENYSKYFAHDRLDYSENESFCKEDLKHLTVVNGKFLLQKPNPASNKPATNSLQVFEEESNEFSYTKFNSCYKREKLDENSSKYFTHNKLDYSENESFCKEDLKHLTVVNGKFLLQKPNPASNKPATNSLQVFEEEESNEFSYTKFNSCYKREKLDENSSKYFTHNKLDYSENESFCKEDLKHLTVVNGTFLLQKPLSVSHNSPTSLLQNFENSSTYPLPYSSFDSYCKRETLEEND